MRRHFRMFAFAVSSLLRNRAKNLTIVVVYSVLVCLVASLLFYVEGLRQEARLLLESSPRLIVQRLHGGRHDLIPADRAETVLGIRGVTDARPRVWGYSFDPPTGATLTLWGANSVPPTALELEEGGFQGTDGASECIVGYGVADARFLGIGDRLPLKGADGNLFAPRVVGIFKSSSAVLTNDLVVLPTDLLRRLFAMDETLATDLAVEVYNPLEVATVARKIQELWPDVRTISREQILRTYEAAFDWRGGIWAALLVSSIAAFAILVWDRATGLSAEEYRTVGVLKAVGWSSRDVMELKAWEGVIISSLSFLTGILWAELHVIWLDGVLFAKVLRGWSVLFPDLDITPVFDPLTLALCVTLAVVPYIVASLLPAWRAAVTDPDAIIRS